MYKIRYILLLGSLVLLVCGCSKNTATTSTGNTSSSAMLYQDAKTSTDGQYKTDQVKKGDFSVTITNTGKKQYTDIASVKMDADNAYIKKILVKEGDTVKKGQPIAQIKVDYDESEKQQKELELKQAEQQYTVGLEQKRTALLAKKISVNKMSEGPEKEIAKTEQKKLEADFKQYQLTSTLSTLRKDYNDYIKNIHRTIVKSTESGIIDSISEEVNNAISSEEIVSMDTIMINVRKNNDFLITVDLSSDSGGNVSDTGDNNNQQVGSNGVTKQIETKKEIDLKAFALRYGQTVTVGLGDTQDKLDTTMQGKVITADNIYGSTDPILIKLQDIPEGIKWDKTIYITYEVVHVKDAILVPVKALSYEEVDSGKAHPYVSVLDNGVIRKRFLVGDYQNNEYFWAEQGIDEGQAVILN